MQVNYNMVIDFARPAKSNTILVAENDANSRNCRFTLLFDKAPFDMTGVTTATVKGILPSGAIVFGDATIVQDEDGNNINELTYLLPLAITQNAGNVTLTVELVDNLGARITSFEYYVKVRNALYNEDDYIDEDDMAGFRDLLARTRAALERMEQMVQQDALPNPYPLRVFVDNVDYEYNGENIVEILMDEVAYLGDVIGTVEITADDSAAAQAARSAASALESAESAENNAEQTAQALQRVIDITDNFEDQIPTVTVEKNGHLTTITIHDKDGTTSETIEDGVVGNRWFNGTDFSGNTPGQTGVAGNIDDYYINPVETKVYRCVMAGDETTALWDYVFTMGGGGGGAQWGDIAGTLSDQTDLQAALTNLENKFKRVVQYAGTKQFSDLTSSLLNSAYVNNFFMLTNDGEITSANINLWNDNFILGDHIPKDSHIAVIAYTGSDANKGSYVFDDFGGFVEVDEFTTPSVSTVNGVVMFPDLNPDYGYDLYVDIPDETSSLPTNLTDLPVCKWTKVQRSTKADGTITLAYTVTNINVNYCLRILK